MLDLARWGWTCTLFIDRSRLVVAGGWVMVPVFFGTCPQRVGLTTRRDRNVVKRSDYLCIGWYRLVQVGMYTLLSTSRGRWLWPILSGGFARFCPVAFA